MAESPIVKTLDNLMAQLKEATETFRESEKSVTGLTAAIRALAQVCEDEEIKTSYLLALEEISGKPGFVEAVRYALRTSPNALSAPQIKGAILLTRKMDLSSYSNPMASIHTTLRRLKDKGEVEEGVNSIGEKVYRLKVDDAQEKMRAAIGRKPGQAPRPLRPQERFSLDHTKPTNTKRD